MNKCPKCGAEFEGKFCPNCGTEWQAEKSCPKCGTNLAGAARFCNNCGYAFYPTSESAAPPTPMSAAKRATGGALVWVKGHKKLVIILSLVLVVALVLAIALPVGLANKDNGTYYAYSFEQFNENEYYKLDGGKWTNASGEKGTYEISGDKITIYQEIFGSNMKLASGTLKDGILTLSIGGAEMKYAMKGAVHVHEYEEWTVVTPSMCMRQGTEIGKCKCGETKTRTLPFAEHKPKNEWEMDEKQHWKICLVCWQKYDEGAHIFDEDSCTICGFPMFTAGLQFDKNDTGDGYIVTGLGSATGPIIRIPAQYDGLPVTSIGSYAFWCSELTNITIPDSVTSIGEGAFISCNRLTSITIPDSVTSIGEGAFMSCYSLTSVTIPDSVASIEHRAFRDCIGLTSVTIPDSVTSIGEDAFRGCSGLTSVTIPNSVTSIGNETFWGCNELTSITIPDSVTSIGDRAFYACRELSSIEIPDSVTSIGERAFEECVKLTSITYQGAVDEWQNVKKGSAWDANTANYIITCTDGTVSKDGTVTRK